MSTYVDRLFSLASRDPQAFKVGARHGHQWCHFWADNLDELHHYAEKIGMKRAWFQDKSSFPHYDLVPPRREAAIAGGAIVTTHVEWMAKRRAGGGRYPCFKCGDQPQVGGDGRGAFLCVLCNPVLIKPE